MSRKAGNKTAESIVIYQLTADEIQSLIQADREREGELERKLSDVRKRLAAYETTIIALRSRRSAPQE